MEAWLIYDKFESERNKEYIRFYFTECERRDIRLRLLLSEDIDIGIFENRCAVFYQKEKISLPDVVICRTMRPILTKHFETMGIPVFNNYFVSSICNDKKKTYQYISSANIKMMDTIFESGEFNENIKFPAVIKPSHGKGGENVYLVKSADEYNKLAEKLKNKDIILQRAASDLGRDLRVYVIGKRIVASMLRVSVTDFRSNFCLGGAAEIYHLNDEEKSIIYKIIDMFDFGLVGIDFIFDSGKLVFNEIEDVVGSRMLYAKTDINIVSEYLDYILSKI